MNHNLRVLPNALLAGAVVLFAIPSIAQAQEAQLGNQTAAVSGDADQDQNLENVQAQWAAIEADTGIEDAVKALLKPKYDNAIKGLGQAADNRAKAAEYSDAIKTAPQMAADLLTRLQALPSAESAAKSVAPKGNADELQKDIDSRNATLEGLKDQLSKATTALTEIKARPAEIGARLPQAQSELSDCQTRLASLEFAADETSRGRFADRLVLQAEQSELQTELETLKQEQLSLSVREDLLQAQHDLLTRQVENSSATLDALQSVLSERLANEVKQAGLAAALPDLPADDREAQAVAAEVRDLAKEFEAVVNSREQLATGRATLKAKLDRLNKKFDDISQELKLGSTGAAMTQVLFDLQHQLRDAGARDDIQSAELAKFDDTRLAAFQVDKRIGGQSDLEKQFADRSSESISQILTTRKDILEKLKSQYRNLNRDLASLEADRQQYLSKVKEIRASVKEQLLWMRSSPPISSRTLTEIPGALKWAFSGKHWGELGSALKGMATDSNIPSASIVLVVVLLLIMRRRISAALIRTKQKIHRISTDRFAYTWEALFWTVLLALPLPLLLVLTGWVLGQNPEASGWMRGIAEGCKTAAWITLATGFMSAVCREEGLGAAHFGWEEVHLTRCRRVIAFFTVVFIPALLVTCSTVYGEGSHYFASIGRFSLMFSQIGAAVALWWLLRFSDGVLATVIREHPTRTVASLRYLWLSLMIGCPLALVVLAGLGYIYTALDLGLGLVVTATLIAGGLVFYSLVVRWFSIRARRLALNEALYKRRARQEMQEPEHRPEEAGEVVSVDPEDEVLDIESLGVQTRQLLRLLIGLVVLMATAMFWSRTIPVFETFDKILVPVGGGISLLSLLKAVFILLVTHSMVRHIPAVLELALRKSTDVKTGTRAAVATLCQYGAIAIGLGLLAGVLNVDWSRFAWIAAALTVGLGFGLQEVVANFVCGLILLFERPIRVGDVVTLEGVTGSVTKIQMRATTITNWDRQDLVVPNKNLITGTILNWTLSASVNRIIIPVGVAYGSDTESARQILLDVAADNEQVLDDPPPMTTFEAFADSSLTLTLRAYLPDVDDRMKTITELHTEIDKRFAEAGIEIAFPQRDLHFRGEPPIANKQDVGLSKNSRPSVNATPTE